MSYLSRINNAINGSKSVVAQIGWIGDSICIANYLGKTGEGAKNQKYSFASVVSSYYGAFSNNQGESGRTLASFLPYLNRAVVGAVAEFDGQWLRDDAQWYFWSQRLGVWVAVESTGSQTNRVGTSVTKFNALLNNPKVKHIVIAQSGVNDNAANGNLGDTGANGEHHYMLMQNEIIRRIQAANKIAIVVTGTTAANPDFHGVEVDLRQKQIGRYSQAARQSALFMGANCCDVGLRLNIEMSLGRVDILCRNSQNRPTNVSQSDWDSYLLSTGDIGAATNTYRVFDESEDELHLDDTYRASFFHNVHPNAFGHRIIANEIIKFMNERGLR